MTANKTEPRFTVSYSHPTPLDGPLVFHVDGSLLREQSPKALERLMTAAPDLLEGIRRCEQEARDEGREWFWIAALVRKATGDA